MLYLKKGCLFINKKEYLQYLQPLHYKDYNSMYCKKLQCMGCEFLYPVCRYTHTFLAQTYTQFKPWKLIYCMNVVHNLTPISSYLFFAFKGCHLRPRHTFTYIVQQRSIKSIKGTVDNFKGGADKNMFCRILTRLYIVSTILIVRMNSGN